MQRGGAGLQPADRLQTVLPSEEEGGAERPTQAESLSHHAPAPRDGREEEL